jgi:hypothetical protein
MLDLSQIVFDLASLIKVSTEQKFGKSKLFSKINLTDQREKF